ncbi:MAG: acyl-CoA dehydrogenase family protein, partial [Acidimicrobiia bacterium]
AVGAPLAVGGTAVEPSVLFGVTETVAAGDGSAGWLTMIYATSSVTGHFLDQRCLDEVFADGARSLVCGVLAPKGRATRVDGGYHLNGRWPFASGSVDANWISLGALIDDGTLRSFYLPREDIVILDTWDVMGLRATASHDVEVVDRFVPDHRVFDLTTNPRTGEPVARFPIYGLLAGGIAAVSLGIARAAIDEAIELGGAKVPTGSKRRLVDRPAMQETIARAETMVAAARVYLLSLAAPRDTATVLERARLRMAATHAVNQSAEAVDLMYTVAGGSSLYSRSPLQRQFRDIHTATQHMMVAQPTWELAGKVFLGLEADTSGL